MYDLIIVGGGIVGLAFGLKYKNLNPAAEILIIEKNTAPNLSLDAWDNRIYAITPHNIATMLDLEAKLDFNRINQVLKMQIHGDLNSELEFKPVNQTEFNQLAYIVEASNLQLGLYQALTKHTGVTFYYQTEIQTFKQEAKRVIITTQENKPLVANYLIAADGANSKVAQLIKGETQVIDYHQAGIVANFKVQNPHQNTAYQWFLTGGDILAFLPLPQNQISIVYSSYDYSKLMALSDYEFIEQLQAISQDQLGTLELITPRQAFNLKLKLRDTLVDNKIILIGDAAHTIHPLAGQGVNLGLQDAWSLASTLAKPKVSQLDLIGYNYHSLTRVRKRQLTCHGLNRLFGAEHQACSLLRNLGLNLINKIPVLKNHLIKEAVL